MSSDEKATAVTRVNILKLAAQDVDSDLPAASTAGKGRLRLSGSKLYFDNGSKWELITSA